MRETGDCHKQAANKINCSSHDIALFINVNKNEYLQVKFRLFNLSANFLYVGTEVNIINMDIKKNIWIQ